MKSLRGSKHFEGVEIPLRTPLKETLHVSDEHEFHPVARWRAQDRHLAAMKEVHVNQSTAYIVSTPDPKPTPVQITPSIMHVILGVSCAGVGLGLRPRL